MNKVKVCSSCKKEKWVSEFYAAAGREFGVRGTCKVCDGVVKLRRRRSKKGILSISYTTQQTNSIGRGHDMPSYSREELLEWCLKQDKFHELYDAWVKSGYKKRYIPSVDRIDDYFGYRLDNIQLLSWEDNFKKYIRDRVSGRNNKTNMAIFQYDLDGNFIAEYHSIRHAARETSLHFAGVHHAAHRKHVTSGGYQWRIASEVGRGVNIGKVEVYRMAIEQYTMEGEFMQEFISASDAFKHTGVRASYITRVCSGCRKTAGGFIWKYKKHERKGDIKTH